jgi:hypothetical protein
MIEQYTGLFDYPELEGKKATWAAFAVNDIFLLYTRVLIYVILAGGLAFIFTMGGARIYISPYISARLSAVLASPRPTRFEITST